MQPYLHILSHFLLRIPTAGPISGKTPGPRGRTPGTAGGSAGEPGASERALGENATGLAAGLVSERIAGLFPMTAKESASVAPERPIPAPRTVPWRARAAHVQTPRARASRPVAALLLAGALAGTIAGCGSTPSTGTTADPAVAVPATAPVYAGAVVRPEGSLKTAALSAGHTLSGQTNPYLQLLGILQTPGSAPLQYGREVAPWLGPHAALFLASVDASTGGKISQLLPVLIGSLTGAGAKQASWPFSAAGLQGALVLDTSDAGKAREFLDSQATHAGAHSASYRGVAYQQTASGVAFALVDRFAVIGSESGVHGVIDTTLGGASLALSTGYSELAKEAPAGELGHIYTDPALYRAPPQGLTALLGTLEGAGPANLSLVPSASSVTLDVDTLAATPASGSGGLLFSGAEATKALGELPAESWLALGVGSVGGTLSTDVKALEGLASLGSSLGTSSAASKPAESTGSVVVRGLSVKSVLKGLLTPLAIMGADTPAAKQAFASWIGPVGLFAAGSGLLELEGGFVIDSKNAAASRAAVPALLASLERTGASGQIQSTPGAEASATASVKGLPLLLVIAAGHDAAGQAKFVVGLGQSSVGAALSAAKLLSGSSSYQAASAGLGGAQPGLIVNVPTVLALLEGAGLAEDPTISGLTPFLRGITTVYGGDQTLGSVKRFKLVLGLHQAG